MATDQDCIFCQIAAGAFGTTFEYESDNVVAFNDIEPLAPVHVLIVPRRHIASVVDLGPGDAELLGELIEAANTVARQRGVVERGFRLVTNCGPDAGQSVFHVHIHLLGGTSLGAMLTRK